jgi:hypothetical protein
MAFALATNAAMSSEADFASGSEPASPLPEALSADDLGLIGSPDIIARKPVEQQNIKIRASCGLRSKAVQCTASAT